jgi:LAO/AO transport system kinase
VIETVATEGEGISGLVDDILAHKTYLVSSGEWEARERAKSRREIGQMLQAEFLDRLNNTVPLTEREGLIDAVAKRDLDPYSAVAKLFAHAAQKE